MENSRNSGFQIIISKWLTKKFYSQLNGDMAAQCSRLPMEHHFRTIPRFIIIYTFLPVLLQHD